MAKSNIKNDPFNKRTHMLEPYRVKCRCGHILYPISRAQVCSYCGILVKPKKQNFKDKLLNIMKGDK